MHDPYKIVANLAVAVTLGGGCLADAGVLRAEPGAGRPGRLRPGDLRLISRLGGDAPAALKAIGKARAAPASGPGSCLAKRIVMDIDATLVTAHSDKEQAAPTWKKGFGFHRLTMFADQGADGSRWCALTPAAAPTTSSPG